ncbi:hypothetical protein E8E13_001067 [Curvularia kusanoi]|uniref:Uncharacterized protein n=1 Tax=Curvularia kusanoi TaxID=90978 RepID=A0A9P4WAF4_CURKU|nr:hypothetical protein E8E13_001067 [Curvularia kusanoi]
MNLTRYNDIILAKAFESTVTAEGFTTEKLSWRIDDSLDDGGFIRTAYRISPADVNDNDDWNMATIPTTLSATQLTHESSIYFHVYDSVLAEKAKLAKATWTMHTPQPVVLARCSRATQKSSDIYYYHDDNSKTMVTNETELPSPSEERYPGDIFGLGNNSLIPPSWIPSPDGSNSSLAVFFLEFKVAAISEVPAYVDYDHGDPGLDNTASSAEIIITNTIEGYGYGATDTSIRLSLAVMIAYSLATTIYIIFIIGTGRTSVAWDSATELIMLALQSQEPDGLGHVSVGLNSMETFRKGVGIRVSKTEEDSSGVSQEKLELVLQDDKRSQVRSLTRVVHGTPY